MSELPQQWNESQFQANKHFLYAKHLLEWLTFSDTVLYHAARAEELDPGKAQYRELHTRCLLLDGQIANASKRGANTLLILRMMWTRTLLRLEQKIKVMCTHQIKYPLDHGK